VSERDRKRHAARTLLVALVVLAGLFPYLQSVGFGFTLDDANTISGHKGVQGPLAYDDIVLRDWWGRSRFDSIGTWRPLATFTFWIDQHIGGGHPWLFHVTNLALYAALLVLFERFLDRWSAGSLSTGARLLAVLVFGNLAIHADVVPSATGRAEILAALFSLAALFASTCTRTFGAREAALAALFLPLALLSKESAAPMAILLPLLAHRMHFARGTFHRRAMTALAVASPLELAAVAGFRALKMPFMQLGPERAIENPLLAVDAPHRLAGALDVFALYLRHLLTGTGLAPDYSFAEPPLLRDGVLGILLGGATLIALVVLVARSWRRAPRVADAAVGFGAAYLTVSNLLVPSSAIADRLFFFPSMWLVALVALLLDSAVRAPVARRVACGVALVFAVLQHVRAEAYGSIWRDDVTLLRAASRVYPDVCRTQRNLAHALADAHDDDGAAWHLTVSEGIYAHYPVPVAHDAIDPAWDDEPLPSRLEHLRDVLGAHATCDAAAVAGARLTSWECAGGAKLLSAWSRGACLP
jgi:hypothetical protein